jgi:hypothetical protein
VPADLKLAQLHDVLQAAMGWQDCHMHEFSVGQQHFGKPNPEDRLMGMDPVENERTVRLSSRLRKNAVSQRPPLLSTAVSDDLRGFGNESVGGYRP